MRSAIALLTAFMLLQGCSTLRTVHVDTGARESRIREINEIAAGRSVEIGFLGGEKVVGWNLDLAADSLRFNTYEDDTAIRVASTAEVETLLVFLHGRTAWESAGAGANAGMYVGVVLSGVLGAIAGASNRYGLGLLDVAVVMGGCMAAGAVIGFPFGWAGEDDILYVLQELQH